MSTTDPSWSDRAGAVFERWAAHPAAGWGVIAFALALRLVGLDKGYWLDEAFTLDISLRDTFAPVLARLRGVDHPPLFFLLLHFVSRLGRSEPFLRLLPVASSVALVAVVVRWAGRFSRLAGVLAGMLTATLPFFLRISHELRPYGLLALAVAAAFAAAERIRSAPDARLPYLALGATLALATFTHHVGVFLLAPVAVLLFAPGSDPRSIRPAPVVAALGAPLAAAAAAGIFGDAVAKTSQFWWMPRPDPALVASALRSFVSPASQSWERLANQAPVDLALAASAITLALLALGAGARSAAARTAAAATLYLAVLIAFSWLAIPVFWNRTATPALPLLAVAVATGAAGARSARVRIALVLGLAAVCLGFATRWLTAESSRPLEPWRAASERILAVDNTEDIVIFYPNYAAPPVRRYLAAGRERKIVQVPFGGTQAAERCGRMLARRRGRGPATVWLVMRLDSPPRPELRTGPALFAAVARERGRRPVRALLVSPLDASMNPGPSDQRRVVAEELRAAFGSAAETLDHGPWIELHFPPPRDPAPSAKLPR